MKDKAIEELILFGNISSDTVVKNAVSLFAVPAAKMARSSGSLPGTLAHDEAPHAYYQVQRAMLPLIGEERVSGTYWQNYIAGLVGGADNAFTRLAEHGTLDHKPAIRHLATDELRLIRQIYSYDFTTFSAPDSGREPDTDTGTDTGTGTEPTIGSKADNIASMTVTPARRTRRQQLHEALTAGTDEEATSLLAEYYHSCGAGDFEAYGSYLWDGSFRGVRISDPITFDDLIGIDKQKESLKENAEFLFRGLPANNVLLYGDSGTGKSSSVKALLNNYEPRGFKLVAVPKHRLADLPKILDAIAGRGLKFIVFIDDLSFDENDGGYKQFKSVLEGGVSARPDNAVICVTSNRRNIVKEVWSDREGQDDVHLRDNLQEKRSLADRFGLTIVFSSPDKREYLDIVFALARKADVRMAEDELRAQALTWEIRHGGRSGRTASQFIAHLKGLQALAELEN
jgi:predicted AAA+ superfamily ATPase